jgi:hypothetical protein
MTLPDIDFQFWYNKNTELNNSREKNIYVTRHHAVATQILKKYLNEKLSLAYFTQLDNVTESKKEYLRIKSLTYSELENEILNYTQQIIEGNFNDNQLILKTFDLIQIWGGRPGGNNIYNKNGDDRTNFSKWLDDYINGVKKASVGDFDSYQVLKSIKHLQLPFASKHINFYSRHVKENSLIIIDEKISHCFKITDPKSILQEDIVKINNLCRSKARELNYEPWQIEKSLFSFHSYYFEAKLNINQEYLHPLDITNVENIKNWYNKTNNKINKKIIVNHKPSEQYVIYNNEFFRTKDNCFFIKQIAIEKCKIPNNKINKNKSLKIKNEMFYNYIGNNNLIKII